MPEQLYGLTIEDIRWLRRLRADLDSGRARILRRREATSAPNIQTVKPSSATLDTSDANEDRYPGHWYERDPSTGTLTQKDAVWIVTPNGETVDTGTYYEGAVQHGLENSRPVFCAIVPGTGGGSTITTPIIQTTTSATNITTTSFADLTNSSQTFSLSSAATLVLTFHVRVAITTASVTHACQVIANVDGTDQTDLAAVSNISTSGTVSSVASLSYLLSLSSGSHTIKLRAKMVTTGSGETALVGGSPCVWVLHN